VKTWSWQAGSRWSVTRSQPDIEKGSKSIVVGGTVANDAELLDGTGGIFCAGSKRCVRLSQQCGRHSQDELGLSPANYRIPCAKADQS